MPPASLINVLGFGLVALVGAGVILLATYYNQERPREEYQYRNQRSKQPPRRRQSRTANGRIVEPCFCGYDERATNCYLRICGHSFHRNCIRTWAEQQSPSPTCPNCRQQFNLQLDLAFII